MEIRQQIIQDHIEKIAQLLNINEDRAFLRFGQSLIVGQSIHAFDPSDFVEGGQDKQIDVITIEEGPDRADVYILSFKNTNTFSSNALIQFHNGLKWIFNKRRKDLLALSNIRLKDKITEYRSLQSGFGPSNIRIIAGFITNGFTSELSEEFQQEVRSIRDDYDNDTFEEFRLFIYGADELVSVLNAQERRSRKINAEIKIRYDTNNPSLIKYYSEDLKGLVCSIPASEIARLVNDDPDESIFDLNIRRFLGTRGAVNKDILSTCTSTDFSHQFWFLNNGITVVCDRFDAVTDPDNPKIIVENLKIVNGCQTATTIALAQREGNLPADIRVLMRIYESTDPDLVNRIVLTTNNQNKISSRDLRANDPIQIDMEKAFEIHNYYYERKVRQFDDAQLDPVRIIPNELVAQAYLAIALKTPSDGRARKYKVWSEQYSRIFSGGNVEPYIICVLILRNSIQWLGESGLLEHSDEVNRKIAKLGTFHVARIAAYLWRGSDEWRLPVEDLRQNLETLEQNSTVLAHHLEQSFTQLQRLIRDNESFSGDIERALKSYELDQQITRDLHTAS